jgi:hypothetical protein
MRDGIRSLRNQPASPKPPDDKQSRFLSWRQSLVTVRFIKEDCRSDFAPFAVDCRAVERIIDYLKLKGIVRPRDPSMPSALTNSLARSGRGLRL